jgi:hypothetical protein
MKVTLKGVEFDFDGVLPLKVRDWRALEKLGIRLSDGADNISSIERAATLAQYVLKKSRPEIAESFVDDLTLEELMSVAGAVPRAEVAAVDRPT